MGVMIWDFQIRRPNQPAATEERVEGEERDRRALRRGRPTGKADSWAACPATDCPGALVAPHLEHRTQQANHSGLDVPELVRCRT